MTTRCLFARVSATFTRSSVANAPPEPPEPPPPPQRGEDDDLLLLALERIHGAHLGGRPRLLRVLAVSRVSVPVSVLRGGGGRRVRRDAEFSRHRARLRAIKRDDANVPPGDSELERPRRHRRRARASFGEYIERPSYISPPDATSNHVIGGMGVATTPLGIFTLVHAKQRRAILAEHPSTSRPS